MYNLIGLALTCILYAVLAMKGYFKELSKELDDKNINIYVQVLLIAALSLAITLAMYCAWPVFVLLPVAIYVLIKNQVKNANI